MAKGNREARRRQLQQLHPLTGALHGGPKPPRIERSLLDAMQDGNEYQSIVDVAPPPGTNLLDEVVRGIAEIEKVRGRPCLAYVGNVVKRDEGSGESAVGAGDDLPFWEMVTKVPAEYRSVDVLVATNGGSAQQVNNFVNCLRGRFDHVDFIIPSFCMSAGTLLAMSGDRIWMTDRGRLGPIDPQVPTGGGRYVPAQALLHLFAEVQRHGNEALKKSGSVPWAYVRLIDSLDKKELGEAMTASRYGETMAAQFLQQYKFRDWKVKETSQAPVTDADRATRAAEIAAALGSHERWKSHGHAISRDVLWNELRLKIDRPAPDFNRAIIRLWALLTYVVEKTPIVKLFCSANYRYLRNVQIQIVQGGP